MLPPSYLRRLVTFSSVSAFSMLAEKMSMTSEEAERYIVNFLEMQD